MYDTYWERLDVRKEKQKKNKKLKSNQTEYMLQRDVTIKFYWRGEEGGGEGDCIPI